MTAQLRVDLAQFDRNLDTVRRTVTPAEPMLVVKDDAYGHGLLPIVRRAAAAGWRWFGAFDVPTGVAVRVELGPEARIFAWILHGDVQARAAVDADLDIGVGTRGVLESVAAAADIERVARLHLKIDTGLHRNGVRPEEWPAFVERCAELERAGVVRVVGLWSHISEASDEDDDAARAVFEWAGELAAAAGLRPETRHLAASAAAFARPDFRYDLVRVGAFCYGIRSAGGPSEAELGVFPVAALEATVTDVADDVVTIGLGYLDGLPSTLAGRITVGSPGGPRGLLQLSADSAVVEAWEGATIGQRITVYGAADGSALSATEVAERIETIGEEIAVRISPLVPRSYVSD